MTEFANCLSCSETGGYETGSVGIKKRNHPLAGQQNRNGTIQYITDFNITLNKIWFTNYNRDCYSQEDLEKKLPDRVNIKFLDPTLEKIFSNIKVLDSTIIKGFTAPLFPGEKLLEKGTIKNLLSIITENSIQQNLLEDIDLQLIISVALNILTLKPEIWSQTVIDILRSKVYVHDGKKFTCNNGLLQETKDKYKIGNIGMFKGGSQAWVCERNHKDNDSSPNPPDPGISSDVQIIFNQDGKEIIDWSMALNPFNIKTDPKEIEKLSVKNILSCKTSSITKDFIADFKTYIDTVNKIFGNNAKYLCDLIRYVKSISEDEIDNVIDCEISFYKNDVLLKPTNANSQIKARLYVSLGNQDDSKPGNPNFTFNDILSINIEINDDSINDAIEEKLAIRLQCPSSIETSQLNATSDEELIKSYITANEINVDEINQEIRVTKNIIFSEEYSNCPDGFEDTPPAELLLNGDFSNKRVKEIWTNFFQKVQKGIICDKSSEEDTDHFLIDNIILSDYKSKFGENTTTYYAHNTYKLDRKPVTNEVIIRNIYEENENLATIDCLTNSFFVDNLEDLAENQLKNTFFEDYQVDKKQIAAPTVCFEGEPALSAREHLFRMAIVKFPIYIVNSKETKNGTEYKFRKHDFEIPMSLPFKSKATGNKVIIVPPYIKSCDPIYIPVTLTINGEQSTKTLYQHFPGYIFYTIYDYFFDLSSKIKNVGPIDSNTYRKLLPEVIRLNKSNIETLFGKNAEIKSEPPDRGGSVSIKTAEFTYNKDDNKTLPCRTKVKEAIANLQEKYNRSINRYHEPLFDYLDDIAKVDNNNNIIVNFLSSRPGTTLGVANRNFYAYKILGAKDYSSAANLINTTCLKIKADNTKTIIGNDNSFLQKIYSTLDADFYNGAAKRYDDIKRANAISAKSLNLPPAPKVNNITLKYKLTKNNDNELLLPDYYFREIIELRKILEENKCREKCGNGLLGEEE